LGGGEEEIRQASQAIDDVFQSLGGRANGTAS
jgi:hypothetical protein